MDGHLYELELGKEALSFFFRESREELTIKEMANYYQCTIQIVDYRVIIQVVRRMGMFICAKHCC